MKLRHGTLLLMIAAAAKAWAALAASMVASPSYVLLGQSVTVVMNVINNGGATVNNLQPSNIDQQGTGNALLVGGPSPASMSLASGMTGTFTFTYSAYGCGTLTFSGYATGTDSGPLSSNDSQSSNVLIDCGPTLTPTPIIVYVTATPPPALGAASIPGNIFHPLQGGSLSLNYSLPYAGQLDISIYNRNGVKVKDIQVDSPAGSFSQAWDGRGDNGDLLASGIYVAVFRGKGLNKSVKLVIIK
jgi:hypothetical protein